VTADFSDLLWSNKCVSRAASILPGPRRGALLIAPLALAVPVMAGAGLPDPLYVKNLSPVTGLFGLPSQRSADTAPARGLKVAMHSAVANHFALDSDRDEFLNLDGETVRLALDLRYGLWQDWELQLEVPWLDHSGGELDKVIDDWHDLWGMPDGGRDGVPRDLLDYRYATPVFNTRLQDDSSGLGDVSVVLTHALYRRDNAVASVALGYKFGTGDEDDFLGSGADDIFVALRVSGEHLSDLPLTWHGQLGYLRTGESDVWEDVQDQNLWFAGLAVDWRVFERWSLIAQLDSHAGPLDSDLKQLGGDAYLATFGVRWRLAKNWSLDASVVEDIRVETAPDVTFQASLRFVP
jgi:hypothetical protein